MAERRCPTTAQVQAMIAAAGGFAVRGGTITTDGAGVFNVVFGTPFADSNYQILFSCEGSADVVIATWTNKTPSGFDITTDDDGGKTEPNSIVDWIAIKL